MKKNNEMKLYELLGVKLFKKIAFKTRELALYPLTIKMTKEKRHDFLYNQLNNYTLGNKINFDKLKDFKKQIKTNTNIHILGLILCITFFFIMKSNSLVLISINLLLTLINTYSLMLQRYNLLRINEIIKKLTPLYEKQKNKIKDELKNNRIFLNNNKVLNNNIDLINNATLEELKAYKIYLTNLETNNNDNTSFKKVNTKKR